MSDSEPFDYGKENTATNPAIGQEQNQCLWTNKFEMLSSQIQDVVGKVLYVFKLIENDSLIKYMESSDDFPNKEYAKLCRIADVVMKQATCDQQFAVTCANICSVIHYKQAPLSLKVHTKNNKITFKEIILHKLLNIINSTAWDQDAVTEHNYSVNVCRFICELFKQKIINIDIIILSIQIFLEKNCDVHIELACNILTVLGQDIYQAHNFTKIFNQLEIFVSNSNTSKLPDHIYTIVLDLINLRHKKLTSKNIDTSKKDNNIKDDKKIKHCLNKGINTVVQFNCSKNAWIPSKFITTNIVDHELFSTLEDMNFMKKVQSIVNKVTLRNIKYFTKMMESLLANNLDKLDKTANVIMNQVIKDDRFVFPFALLCSALQHIQVPIESVAIKNLNKTFFKDLIVNKCMDMFNIKLVETTIKDENTKNYTVVTVEKENNFKLDEENYEKIYNYKTHLLSNCRFLLELYKQNIVNLNCIYECLNNLIKENNEVTIECVYIILSMIEKKLIEKFDMSNIYKQLKYFILNREALKLSKRIYFLITDILGMTNIESCEHSKSSDPSDDWRTSKNVKNLNVTGNSSTLLNLHVSPKFKTRNHNNNENNILANNNIVIHKLKGKEFENYMRLIFNQVNTYNVKCLSKKLQKFNLYNLNHIKRCVNVIVDQAVVNPSNSKLYAKLCIVLKKRKAPYPSQVNGIISFQEAIVHKLQENFDTAIIEIETICKNENTDDVKMNLSHILQQNDNKRLKIREKVLANCKFLLELYEAQILLSEHIVKFIETLMLKPHEELLECTCHIILYTSYELVLSYDINTLLYHLNELCALSTSERIHYLLNRISIAIDQWKAVMTKSQRKKIKKKNKLGNNLLTSYNLYVVGMHKNEHVL